MAIVFVRLLDEGVDVWRPASATALGEDRYRLIAPVAYDPETETWEFLPDAVVECETRALSGRPALVAIRLASGRGS